MPTCFKTEYELGEAKSVSKMNIQPVAEPRRLNEGAVSKLAKAIPTTMPTCFTIIIQLGLRGKG